MSGGRQPRDQPPDLRLATGRKGAQPLGERRIRGKVAIRPGPLEGQFRGRLRPAGPGLAQQVVLAQLHVVELQQGLAAAMAGTVTDDTVDELVAEARRAEHGESRQILLLGLKRLRSPAARTALEGLVDDPELGENARSKLKGW